MPPDRTNDYDLHLERSIHELNDLEDDLSFDVFMIYCRADIPDIGKEDQLISPRRIYDDLTAKKFKV